MYRDPVWAWADGKRPVSVDPGATFGLPGGGIAGFGRRFIEWSEVAACIGVGAAEDNSSGGVGV